MDVNLRELKARRRELLRSLGDELRRYRLDAGISQAAVARAARVSKAHLSVIEAGTGEASLEVLLRVGAVLGLDPSVRWFANSGPCSAITSSSRWARP